MNALGADLKIIGYYTKSACVSGRPTEADTPIKYAVENQGSNPQIIPPPLNSSSTDFFSPIHSDERPLTQPENIFAKSDAGTVAHAKQWIADIVSTPVHIASELAPKNKLAIKQYILDKSEESISTYIRQGQTAGNARMGLNLEALEHNIGTAKEEGDDYGSANYHQTIEMASLINLITDASTLPEAETYRTIKGLLLGNIGNLRSPKYFIKLDNIDPSKHSKPVTDFLLDRNGPGLHNLPTRAAIILFKLFLLSKIDGIVTDQNKKATLLAKLANYHDGFIDDRQLSPFVQNDRITQIFDGLIRTEAARRSGKSVAGKSEDDRFLARNYLSLIALVFNYLDREEYARKQAYYLELKNDPDKHLAGTETAAVRQARETLQPYFAFIDDSAKAHNVPPEFIAATILLILALKSDRRFDEITISQGMQLAGDSWLSPFIAKVAPAIDRLPVPRRDVTDFCAGVLLNSSPSIGICQVRASGEISLEGIGVREVDAFSRFNIYVAYKSNARINLMLLNPKYNIEMYALSLRRKIDAGIASQQTGYNPLPFAQPDLAAIGYKSFAFPQYNPFFGPDGIIKDMGASSWHRPGFAGFYLPPLAPNGHIGDVRNTDYLYPFSYFPQALELALKTGLFSQHPFIRESTSYSFPCFSRSLLVILGLSPKQVDQLCISN